MKQLSDIAVPTPAVWSKQRSLSDALLAMARTLGPGQRMPTVRQLCASFAVSTSTLDVVLRDLETRGILLREHGRGIYVAPTIAQKTVGVVFGGDIFSPPFSPFWGLLLQAVREQAEGYSIRPLAYLDISQEQAGLGGHAQLQEDLQAHRLDGLLLLAPHHTMDEIAPLRAAGVPLVVFGGKGQEWQVTHDMAEFTRLAAHAVSARTCGRVALLGHGVLAFHQSILDMIRRHHPAVQLIDWSYETWARHFPGINSHENLAYRLTQRMLDEADQTPLPDSLISFDDTMTRGVIAALQQAGLRPGRDLHIVTCSNKGSSVLDLYANEVVCLEYDPAESARAALAMLTTLMTGGTPPHNPVLIAPTCKGEHP